MAQARVRSPKGAVDRGERLVSAMRDLGDLAFAGPKVIDRAQALRADADALEGLAADGLFLPLWRGRVVLDHAGPVWVTRDHAVLRQAVPAVFLGIDSAGRGRFAADLSAWVPDPALAAQAATGPLDAGRQAHPDLAEGQVFGELRQALTQMDAEAGEFAAMARALTEWHRSHGHCSACGVASMPEMAGWHRLCPACGTRHFPRTDPVVIMLVTCGNRMLIGRSPGWPEGMYSCLAGFMEPGETVEAAVRREVVEETGILCGQVDYVASQPWPFPSSLMIGCHARAISEEITLDPVEIEDALWVRREEMVEALEDRHPRIRAPRKGAIARVLISNWLAGRLE